MKYIFSAVILLSFNLACSADVGPTLLGAVGSVFVHESGHALTSKLLGGEVLAFRPYPTKIKIPNPDGTDREKWTAGVVMSRPFEGEGASVKNAWVGAMGSGLNLASVFLLAPLLPEMGSRFGKESLDSMLFFQSFDMATYTLVDMIFRSPENDWSRVARLSGVSIEWFFVAGLAGGWLANEYRFHYHKKAFRGERRPDRLTVGYTSRF